MERAFWTGRGLGLFPHVLEPHLPAWMSELHEPAPWYGMVLHLDDPAQVVRAITDAAMRAFGPDRCFRGEIHLPFKNEHTFKVSATNSWNKTPEGKAVRAEYEARPRFTMRSKHAPTVSGLAVRQLENWPPPANTLDGRWFEALVRPCPYQTPYASMTYTSGVLLELIALRAGGEVFETNAGRQEPRRKGLHYTGDRAQMARTGGSLQYEGAISGRWSWWRRSAKVPDPHLMGRPTAAPWADWTPV